MVNMMTDLQKHLGGVTDPAVLAELDSWYADYYPQAMARFKQRELLYQAVVDRGALDELLEWCRQATPIPAPVLLPPPRSSFETFKTWIVGDIERRLATLDADVRMLIAHKLGGTLH